MINEHLRQRGFNPALYSNCCIDTVDNVLTVYMYTATGAITGFQQYRPNADKLKANNPRDGRYYTYIAKGNIPMWGVESLAYSAERVYVVEGIFDACRLHNLGVPAIACFGSYNDQLKNWLVCTGRKVYTINDSVGVNNKLSCFKNIELPSGRGDVGECTDKEIEHMLRNQ